MLRTLQGVDAGHRIHDRNSVVACSPESRQGRLRKFRFVMDEDYTGWHRVSFSACRANCGSSLSRHISQFRERILAQRIAPVGGAGGLALLWQIMSDGITFGIPKSANR